MQEQSQERPLQGRLAEGLVLLAACGLAAAALMLDEGWLERRFLPEFFHPREQQRFWLGVCRGVLAVLAVVLAWPVRSRVRRWAAGRPARALALDVAPTLLAVVLALAASEVLLRQLPWFSTREIPTQREPLRRRDPVLGWTYEPGRVGRGELGGRTIEYAFDAGGRRVRRAGDAVDPARPSLLFVGESIIAGHGVTYDETIPGRVGARLGLQPVNLAVGGYATDQMLLRLKAEWPLYRRPCALVILFMPSLFHRNLEHDRPHLDADLAWRPASDDPRLVQIVRRLAPYRSDRALAEGLRMTRGALSEMVRMAEARGAVPVILVPELTPETREEAAIREAAISGLPALKVRIDPSWRLRNNRHPDARADARLAQAVAEYLEGRGLGHGSSCPR